MSEPVEFVVTRAGAGLPDSPFGFGPIQSHRVGDEIVLFRRAHHDVERYILVIGYKRSEQYSSDRWGPAIKVFPIPQADRGRYRELIGGVYNLPIEFFE